MEIDLNLGKFSDFLEDHKKAVALLAVAVLLLAFAPSLMDIVPGYEGAKFYFRGVKYGGKVWTDDMPAPSGASVWNFQHDSLNLDPDAAVDGVQNLIVSTSTNGQVEKNPFGDILSKTVEWEVVVSQNTTMKVTKKIRATVYYFTVDQSYTTRVDEGLGAPYVNTEKYTPWKDFVLYGEVDAYNWNRFDGNLTSENFACLLGVEVVNWEYTSPGRDFRWEPNFQGGQMLTMYDTVGGSEIRPLLPEQAKGSDIKPDVNSRSTAFVNLAFGKVGVETSTFGSWEPGMVHLKLRVHVLKVDKWLCIQTYGGTYTAPPPPGPTPNWLSDLFSWFTSPFAQLGSLLAAGTIAVAAVAVAFAAIVIVLTRGKER